MNRTEPIRDKKMIEMMKMYLRNQSTRNYLLFVFGINSNLRIGDILSLRVKDVWSNRTVLKHILIKEQKTGKLKKVRLNESIVAAIKEHIKTNHLQPEDYLFQSKTSRYGNKPIDRVTAFRILSEAGERVGLPEPVSPHSLRKTWGYWAWKQGIALPLIMEALNHSNQSITRRYLGINQDELDDAYMELNL
ncbi:site-specific integrase [Anoxynatronum sibiricum]|uniref:Site-specific integrase n=1 Tax=Anoxynatronum sibiricum TaxID=210623 RepID=A0ABU9VX37_9CLOT